MDRDRLRQVAVVVSAVGLIALALTGDFGEAPDSESLIIPANYAFGIWAPIFVGAVAFAVHQAAPARRADPLLRRVAWPLATGYVLAGLWVWVFPAVPLVVSLLLVAANVVAAGQAFARLGPARRDTPPRETWLVRAPVGLFAGWITLATAASTTELLLAQDVGGLGLGRVTWAILILLVAGAIAVGVTLRYRGSLAYPAALTWGFIGSAALHTGEAPAVGAVAGLMALATFAAAIWTGWQVWGGRAPSTGRLGRAV
jgi:hypothetical protein